MPTPRTVTLGRILAFGLLVAIGGGCQNKVYDENRALHSQNRQLQSQLSQRPDAGQVTQLQQEIADRDAKLAALQAQLQTPAPGQAADPGMAGIETSYDAKAGTLTVNLPGDVLFGAGQADLKDSAKTTLDKVVAALKKDYAGKAVRVEGHTDADPIKSTKGKWEDNLDLSLTRAAAVTRYLEQQGVSDKSITTSGYGAARAKPTKAASRRVEIVVVVG